MLIHSNAFLPPYYLVWEQRSSPWASRAMPFRGLHPRPPIGGSPPRAALLISYGKVMTLEAV